MLHLASHWVQLVGADRLGLLITVQLLLLLLAEPLYVSLLAFADLLQVAYDGSELVPLSPQVSILIIIHLNLKGSVHGFLFRH